MDSPANVVVSHDRILGLTHAECLDVLVYIVFRVLVAVLEFRGEFGDWQRNQVRPEQGDSDAPSPS
jgi:hypothetical protein